MIDKLKVTTSGCTTCNNQALKSLGNLQGVFGAEIDRIDDQITVSHTDEVTREKIAEVLTTLGFSEIQPQPSER